MNDLRFALRQLAKNPGFTAVVVLTLALGIGANSAIFSVVNAVLLRPLEYAEPNRLVFIHSQFPGIGFEQFWTSPPEYRELQEHTRSFSDVGAWRVGSESLSGLDTPMRVTSAAASAEFFSALGVAAQLGRTYSKEEDVEGAAPVVVISHRIWQDVFDGDPEIVGRQIEVDGELSTVIGVMPAGFDIEDAGVDLWEPLGLPVNPENRSSHFLNLVGRLAPGVTLEQAQAEMTALVARWEQLAGGAHAPIPERHGMVVKDFREEMVGDFRTPLLILMGAVGFVLLIACANVANLQLARAETRKKEIAVRAAMGAGRGRLLRQFLTESVVLSLLGGGCGLLLGYWGLDVLLSTNPGGVPRLDSVGLDPAVLLFTLGVTLLTGLLFGLAPLLHLSHPLLGSTLKEDSRGSTAGAGRKRLRRLLVVSEIALAVVLVIGSGLLMRSFAALQEVDTGFDPDGLITFELYLPERDYPDGADRNAFLNRLISRLEALPGVEGAAGMSGLPPVRDVNANTTEFEAQVVKPGDDQESFTEVDYYQTVTGDYFETMGISIVQGRGFYTGTDVESTPMAIVNQRLAQAYYPGENPIGRRIRPCCGDEIPWLTIIGVAEDVKQGGLSEETGTELYFYYPQVAAAGFGPEEMNIVVRSTRSPAALMDEIRRTVHSLDRSLPVAGLQTMQTHLAGSISGPRFLSLLLTIFGTVALLLAAVGAYGVLSYSVAERQKEIGIRMAVGARRRSVMGMVLRDGLTVAAAGLVLGILGAFVLTQLLETLLFSVSSLDPLTFVLAPVVLALVAAAACYLPARRATRVDPAVTLRAE